MTDILFIPVPLDWYRNPKCRRLRDADPANEGRWIFVVSMAHVCRHNGTLTSSDGTPLTAEDLAYDHDRNPEGWSAFIELCQSLGLLTVNEGIISISVWKNWSRDTLIKREQDRLRKRQERSEKSLALDSSQAARMAPVTSSDDDSFRVRPSLSELVHDRPNLSEKVALDQIRSDQSRLDQIPPNPPGGSGESTVGKLKAMTPGEVFASAHGYLLKTWKRVSLSPNEDHDLRHVFANSSLPSWKVFGHLVKASNQVAETRAELRADPARRRYLGKKPISDVIDTLRELIADAEKPKANSITNPSPPSPRNLSAEWRASQQKRSPA